MPNYLQRVVTGGARTTSGAARPALASVLLPQAPSPGWLPPGQGKPTLPTIVSEVELPAGLVSADEPTPRPPDEPPTLPTIVSEVEVAAGLVSADEPTPRPPDEPMTIARTSSSPVPVAPAVQLSSNSTLVVAPKGLRSSPSTPMSSQRVTARRGQDRARPEHPAIEAQSQPAPVERVADEEKVAIAEVHVQSVGLRATAVQQAPASRVPGPAADRRRAQISIGRVEVQVNNPPPAASPNPRSGEPPAYPHVFEARYLDRFFLKP
jgi:hypothetical protein